MDRNLTLPSDARRSARRPIVLGALGVALSLAASMASAQVVTEFSVPTGSSGPTGMTVGPDGALWFVERYQSTGNVGRITTSGSFTEFPIPTPNAHPFDITAGPDGNLWFTESGANQIGRITTAGTISEFAGPSAMRSQIIAPGPDGNLWFTETFNNKIGRITTAGVITEFDIPTVASEPIGITAGPDGNLWFAEFGGSRIGRISTVGTVTEFPLQGVNQSPEWIITGPDGALWFTNGNGSVGRITTAGKVTTLPVTTVTSLDGMTVGPDNELWTVGANQDRVFRLTTTGFVTEYPIPTSSSTPQRIRTGPDGNLWFNELNGDQIGRITPGTLVASSLTPSSGDHNGVPGVVIGGAAFDPAATVVVGGASAPSVVVNGPASITITTPNLSPGAVYPVFVTNPNNSKATIWNGWFADFLDVPGGSPFHAFIEKLVRNSITAGCGPGIYCPTSSVTRAQMAVFLLRSNDGAAYFPPNCSAPTFSDVPCSSPYAVWVDELAARNVTAGCGGGLYCPNDPVTRAQMAVFLLKTHDGPAYVPPACAAPTFADVPCSSPFARWVNELALRGITAGCGGGDYCPATPVTRGQMAVFLVTTFSLS